MRLISVFAFTESCGVNPKFLKHLLNRNKYFLKFDDGVTQTHILNHH